MSRHGKNCAHIVTPSIPCDCGADTPTPKVEAATPTPDEGIGGVDLWRTHLAEKVATRRHLSQEEWRIRGLVARIDAQAAQIAVLKSDVSVLTERLKAVTAQGAAPFLLSQNQELREQRAALNAQVTRLQEANSKEVERRREAERQAEHRLKQVPR